MGNGLCQQRTRWLQRSSKEQWLFLDEHSYLPQLSIFLHNKSPNFLTRCVRNSLVLQKTTPHSNAISIYRREIWGIRKHRKPTQQASRRIRHCQPTPQQLRADPEQTGRSESHDPTQVHRSLRWINSSLAPLDVSQPFLFPPTAPDPWLWVSHSQFQWQDWAGQFLSWRGQFPCNLQDLAQASWEVFVDPLGDLALCFLGPFAYHDREWTSLY